MGVDGTRIFACYTGRALLIAGSLLWATAPGSAEPETGSRMDPALGSVRVPDRIKADDANRILHQFGRCVGRQRPKRAEACMGSSGGELRFKPMLLTGGMAEELYLARYRAFPVEQLGGAATPADGSAPRNGLEDIGECVVGRAPRQVRALFDVKPGSKEEGAAIKART